MADIMHGGGVTLLDRMDFLRAFLLEQREEVLHLSMQARPLRQAQIDLHLATLDDACEALQG